MFHSIRQPILDRMKYLEQVDERDRTDSTPRSQRLRQIPPETGKFLALLAASAPEGMYIEIGTSAGYSTLTNSPHLRSAAGESPIGARDVSSRAG
jgi:caffeoyl-CoA O-methyltransferase